ncbi:MAG: hypothetical protein R3D33_03290 [Hyphomicrobiaceae bacterium]
MARAFSMGHEAPLAGGPAASTDALYELGLMYCTGRGVAADLVAAHKWFNLAALKGNAAAKTYRAEIAREMTKAEIAEAQRLAREYLKGH